MRNALFRSTPFRVAVIVGATFFVGVVMAAIVAFELIESELNQRMDRTIADTFDVIAQSYGDSDVTDLTDSVQSHARSTLNQDRVYGLAIGGKFVAGNISMLPLENGWTTTSAAQLGIENDGDDPYRVYVGNVGDGRLLVGASYAETMEVARLSLTSLGVAGGIIAALVVLTGTLLAVRGQRRLDGIARTMARVGLGELDARIRISSRRDDIDVLARQVNDALDRLSALVEGMRQVSINIAHDLKTPLNRLAITVETALNADGGHVEPLLEQAQLEITQLNSTFDALLRIAQIEAGARRERFVLIQLGQVLTSIADVYTDVADEGGQSLSVSVPEPLPAIEGDRELLIQLCANLVENSIRHTPKGTHIGLSAAVVASRVVLTFSDDGPGIPSGEHERVFERLYRLEKSRTTPGSGLGLSMVKAIAELHGARITMKDGSPGLEIAVGFPAVGERDAPLGGG